jgi:protein-S-isoprenylcysteine O-methyltransferase Ste14
VADTDRLGRAEETTLSEESYNKPLGIARLIALWILIGVLVVLAKPTPLGVTVGFVIAALGEAVRFWAAGHLLKTKELITSGPYRYTRNPLYFGRFLIFTGLCIMAQMPYGANWVVLVFGYAVFFGYYMPRKERVEPARLKAEHGAPFERYFAAVPALFPTLRPYDQPSAGGWSSDRMLRNREHWMVIGILVISAVLLVKAYRVPKPAQDEPVPVETSSSLSVR